MVFTPVRIDLSASSGKAQTEQTQINQTQQNHAFEFVELDWLQTGHGGPLPEYD
jgi:hypothetical protein